MGMWTVLLQFHISFETNMEITTLAKRDFIPNPVATEIYTCQNTKTLKKKSKNYLYICITNNHIFIGQEKIDM